MLEQAIALHREGRLKEAASLYRQFLNQNPDHAEALGLLGVTEVQAGNPSAGLAFLDRAIWLEPQNPILHNNRGNALRDLKRLEEARAAYDRALALKPDFAQARNNRGNVLSDLRRFEEAVANFDGLIRMQPQLAAAHFHRGNALQQLGRHADALSSFDRALFVKPDHADAHNNRGIALHQLKRSREALAAFDRSLAIRDSNPGCWNNRGNLLLDLKQLDEALANFDRALAIKPDYAQAFYNRGIVLREMKRLGESLESFNRAIALEPDNAKAHSGSGAVLCDLKRPEEALASLDRALALEPRYADALLNRGVALRDAKRFADAMESMDRAYALEPENAGVLNGRGVALLDVERFDEALTALDRALELEPDHAQAHYNRGMVLLNLNRPRDALASHARALALEPDYPDALFGEGVCHLTLGEFSRGWAGYEHRWRIRTPAFSRRSHGLKDWAGEDLRGRSILVYAEQGAGDTIQFARYLPLLASRGASVTFLVEERLLSLLGPLSDDVRLASNVRPGERFDFQCALLSIPYWLRTSLATIPPSAPYLYADPKRSAEWARRIGTHGFKVGIHWQGGLWQGGASIAGRSIPLREFQPLSQISGVRLISLQKNFGAEQLDRIPPGMRVERLDKFDDGPDAFLDSAAVIDCLDLVVTCDTSIAHLAGALAAPVWVALKNVPDWRWMVDRSDSPWYPTMRLFRQKTLGDWPGVFRAVAAAVKAAIAERSEDR